MSRSFLGYPVREAREKPDRPRIVRVYPRTSLYTAPGVVVSYTRLLIRARLSTTSLKRQFTTATTGADRIAARGKAAQHTGYLHPRARAAQMGPGQIALHTRGKEEAFQRHPRKYLAVDQSPSSVMRAAAREIDPGDKPAPTDALAPRPRGGGSSCVYTFLRAFCLSLPFVHWFSSFIPEGLPF